MIIVTLIPCLRLSSGIWYSSMKFLETYVWKLGAAMGRVTGQSSSSKPICPMKRTVLAWVIMSHNLLVKKIKISMNGFVFNVSCPDFILTSCISDMDDHTNVLVLKQPSLIVLPMPVNDPRFDDKELQVTEEN